MDSQEILFEVKDGIGYATINRPGSLNAINRESLGQLVEILHRWSEDARCRVLIVTGAGDRAFSAGADLGVFAGKINDSISGREWSRYGQSALSLLDYAGKPSIAAIDGIASGGGCELALACTFRIATERAKFSFPEISVGIMPGWGGTQRLVHLVGKAKAMELVLTGQPIAADEAFRIGLVNALVPPGRAVGGAEELARKIIEKPPLAVKFAMEAVNRAPHLSLDEGLVLESDLAGLLCGTDDAKEGIQAFMQKRKPVFRGS